MMCRLSRVCWVFTLSLLLWWKDFSRAPLCGSKGIDTPSSLVCEVYRMNHSAYFRMPGRYSDVFALISGYLPQTYIAYTPPAKTIQHCALYRSTYTKLQGAASAFPGPGKLPLYIFNGYAGLTLASQVPYYTVSSTASVGKIA